MTTFWTPLSDDDGLELFGSLWPLDGDELRTGTFLRRACELGEDASWPIALGALATAFDRAERCSAKQRCALEAARLAVRWEQPATARIAGTMALELAAESDQADADVDAMLHLGYALSDVGESAMAYDVYASCRRVFEERHDVGGVAHVDMNVAIVHVHEGEAELAIEMYTSAAQVFDRLGDTSGLLACWNNLIGALRSVGKPSEALVVGNRLVDRHRESGDRLLTAHAICNRANALADLEEWELAREGRIEALETYRKLGLPTEQADCLDGLASIARHDGLLDFAEQMHLEALRLYEGRHHPIDEAICRYNLAITCVHAGRFAEAIPLCDLATDVGGTDIDPGVVKAAALDGVGDHKQADRLRAEWLERYGQDALDKVLKVLP